MNLPEVFLCDLVAEAPDVVIVSADDDRLGGQLGVRAGQLAGDVAKQQVPPRGREANLGALELKARGLQALVDLFYQSSDGFARASEEMVDAGPPGVERRHGGLARRRAVGHAVAVLVRLAGGGDEDHAHGAVLARIGDLGVEGGVPAPAAAEGVLGGGVARRVPQDDHHLAFHVDSVEVVVVQAAVFLPVVGRDAVADECQGSLDRFSICEAKGRDLAAGGQGDRLSIFEFDDRPGVLNEAGALGNGEMLKVGAVVSSRLEAVFSVETRDVLRRNLKSGLAAVAASELVARQIGNVAVDFSGVRGELFGRGRLRVRAGESGSQDGCSEEGCREPPGV